MKKRLPTQRISFKKYIFARGFTLIELLIAITLTSVLGTLTFAAFSQYNDAQLLENATSDVVTMLNRAKSSSQSQVKPKSSDCPGEFYGWWVNITTTGLYEVAALCTNPASNKSMGIKNLPQGLTFRQSHKVYFKRITGEVIGADGNVIASPHVINIVKNGTTVKTITVGPYGSIDVQ